MLNENDELNDLDELTEAELEAGVVPEYPEIEPPRLPPSRLPPVIGLPNRGISRPEITERTKEFLRKGAGFALRGGEAVLNRVPLPEREIAEDGLSDLFEVPHPHDHDMETADLFEVPDIHDNDMEVDDLFEVSDEDILGGDEDMSDLFSVTKEDIMGSPKQRPGLKNRSYRRVRVERPYPSVRRLGY